MADEKGGMNLFGPKNTAGAGQAGSGGMGGFSGMLGKHPAAGPSPSQIADLSSQIGNVSRRLRMIEERYTNIRNKTQMTDQNLLQTHKDTSKSFKVTNDELLELKREFIELKDKVKLIIKELKDTAKSDEMRTLQKYVEMWEPLNFVTRNEAKKIVSDLLDERFEEMGMNADDAKRSRQ